MSVEWAFAIAGIIAAVALIGSVYMVATAIERNTVMLNSVRRSLKSIDTSMGRMEAAVTSIINAARSRPDETPPPDDAS